MCGNIIKCCNCDFWYRIGGRSYEGECRPTGNKGKKETLYNFSCGYGVPVQSSLLFQGVTV
jgi:primosomal protein N'